MESIITKELFKGIKNSLQNYKYNTICHYEFDDIHEYKLLTYNNKVILLFGYNQESKKNEYLWAGNTAEELLNAIGTSPVNTVIAATRLDWNQKFKQAGFVNYAAWADYFMQSLENINCGQPCEFLTDTECESASDVTLSCRYQSRGFTGQTPEWMHQWLKGTETSAKNSGTKNNAVLIHRNINGKIVGIVCTATYADNSIVWIRLAAVVPEYQGQGIARKLILQALSYGKSHGAARAFLAADECNISAIHLYKSVGFSPKAEETGPDMIKV